MISGDTRQRNATIPVPDPPMSLWGPSDKTQLALSQKSTGFNCLNYALNASHDLIYPAEGAMEYHYIRNKTFMDATCWDGLRLELQFPSCWDGQNLTSANHKSHIQFPGKHTI